MLHRQRQSMPSNEMGSKRGLRSRRRPSHLLRREFSRRQRRTFLVLFPRRRRTNVQRSLGAGWLIRPRYIEATCDSMIGLMREIPVSEHFERSIYGPHEISNPLINQYEAPRIAGLHFLQSLKLFGSTAPSSVDDRTLSEGAVQDAGRDVRSEAASDRGEVASHEHEPVFYSPLECTLAASKQASSPTAQWARRHRPSPRHQEGRGRAGPASRTGSPRRHPR